MMFSSCAKKKQQKNEIKKLTSDKRAIQQSPFNSFHEPLGGGIR